MMRPVNKQLVAAQPMNVSFNSEPVPLKSIFMYCISAIVTGTPTGTIKLQASNDPETNDTQYNTTSNLPPSVAPTNWVDIADSSFALSASGETMWNVTDVGYTFVRVSYADASSGASTATANIRYNGKGA